MDTQQAQGRFGWGPPTEAELVEAWRLKRLLDAGYPVRDAEQLAVAGHVDLHQAVELAGRCEPRLAALILL
ncbi:MAG TPA: hypothetical protein VE985_02110 [Gaiellaceae bacterium]|nr:hypothetical protein [Gaiellaceae bacterium]